MDLGLDGKISWVLGGSSGIGYASALALAREGSRVAVSARRPPELERAAEAIERESSSQCIAVPVDVTDPGSIRAGAGLVRERLGDVDVLVANAGGPPPGRFDTFEEADMKAAFDLTAASAWQLVRTVLPSMRSRRTGCLVFVTSSATKEVIDGLSLSNMMRPAVVGMAKNLSREVARDGVRVVCVAPGRTDTPRVRVLDEAAARAGGEDPARFRAAREAALPMTRYGRPEEIADVVAFAASERASYLTGVTLLVDGGASTGLLA